jgi:polar amino acid transport system permease protein/cystine transport system permease protein
MQFNFSLFLGSLPTLLDAAATNLRISLIAMVIAVAGGTLLTILRTFRWRPLSLAINLVISFIRGTPILIQIFLFYYGLPVFGLDLSPITAGVCAISFNSVMFVTEIMRGGLSGMDPGPVEASIALGMKHRTIWSKIVLPQLFIRVLPPLVNELTIIVKGTTLLSVITVVEVLRTAQQLGNAAFSPLEPILGAALVLFLINFVLSRLGRLIEHRFAARRG